MRRGKCYSMYFEDLTDWSGPFTLVWCLFIINIDSLCREARVLHEVKFFAGYLVLLDEVSFLLG